MAEPNPYEPSQSPAPVGRSPSSLKRTVAVVVLALLTPVAAFLSFGFTCEAVYARRPPQGGPDSVTGVLVLMVPCLVTAGMIWITVRVNRCDWPFSKTPVSER